MRFQHICVAFACFVENTCACVWHFASACFLMVFNSCALSMSLHVSLFSFAQLLASVLLFLCVMSVIECLFNICFVLF